MPNVSILIPARSEKQENIHNTLKSITENATGDYEIIVGLEGDYNYDIDHPKTRVVHFPGIVGIKININALASLATGKYIYKSDAHCAFSKGFDEIMANDMQDEWLMMPRFKILTPDWQIQKKNDEEEFYDYFYLCCPFTDKRGFRFKAGGHWVERTKERLQSHPHLDDTPQIHGSGWMMTRQHFFDFGGFPNVDPHGHAQEPIWLALKNWMWGSRCVVNKHAWYAHMHQQGNKRGYNMSKEQEDLSYKIAVNYWMGELYPNKAKGASMEWFIDRFWPMPTWPEDWKEVYKYWKAERGLNG